MPDSLRDLAQQLDRFAGDRDWQQFHSPKNLASALVVEAGELLEHVLLYLIQLTSALGIDPIAAARAKLELNELKYPVALARGTSKKYDEL